MKIFITGGAGFIGSHLAFNLVRAGHDVSIYDNLSASGTDYVSDLSCTIINADILNVSQLEHSMAGTDITIHLAAEGNVVASVADPGPNFETNVRGTINVLEACRKNNVSRIVFSSTGGALMGDTPPPVDENSLPNPISPYGSSKLSAESYIKTYSKCYDLPHTIFRFGNVLGTHSLHKKGVVNSFYKKIKRSENISVFGNVSRDFIYVNDLVDTIVHSLEHDKSKNEIFHLSSGVETQITDLAHMMLKIMNASNDLLQYKSARIGEVGKNVSSNKKVIKHLGYKNSKDVNEVLEEVIDYFDVSNYQ